MGSALRGRGKGAQQRKAAGRDRITPAWAGKRAARKHTPRRYRDHPRVCGEKNLRRDFTDAAQGSPPRVRGKGVAASFFYPQGRITPACAGKRCPSGQKRCLRRDHPRVCGEKVESVTSRPSAEGSPPRVRGKGGAGNDPAQGARITPACAGKRTCAEISPTRRRDHPRVCGEKEPPTVPALFKQGSPPRMRGKGMRPP